MEKDLLKKWLEETNDFLIDKAHELVKYAKKDAKDYGDLHKDISMVKKMVSYGLDYKCLIPVIEMALNVVENEKNAIPIKDTND